jgi:hypothetical protein
MVYVYYNLRLWVRQLQKTPDVEAICWMGLTPLLHGGLRPRGLVMDLAPDWLQEEAQEEVERESVVEEEDVPE